MLNLAPLQEIAYAEIKRRVEKFNALSKLECNALYGLSEEEIQVVKAGGQVV